MEPAKATPVGQCNVIGRQIMTSPRMTSLMIHRQLRRIMLDQIRPCAPDSGASGARD
jgi:hypothetical protein